MQLAGMRLGLGLPGSLIRFAPLAFVSQRQVTPRDSPSPLVFLRVSTHFTAPPGVPVPLERPLVEKYLGPFRD